MIAASRPERARRNQAVETLRIASAYGIIQFHAHAPAWPLAYAGLIVFLVLSPLLDVLINWDRARSPITLARSLLLPWAFWMVVYGLVNLALHKPLLPFGHTLGSVLLGTSEHLWFLPFMFSVLVILNQLKPRIEPQVLFWACAIAGAAMLSSVMLWRPPSIGWPVPTSQWIHATPPVLVGVALGLAPRAGKRAILGLALLLAGLAVTVAAHLPGLSLPYGLGFAATALAVFAGAQWFPPGISVQPVADCMLGVYLVHILALSPASRLLGHGTSSAVALAFTASLAAIWLIRRTLPISRHVL